MADTTPAPLVSVVLLNFRGAADTVEALQALDTLDWPRESLEIIVVDNASGDDSVATLKKAFPRQKIIESAHNTGFTGGCNLGAQRARGTYVAFLNNDARPDPGWVRAAVEVLEESTDVGAVACKVLTWDGTAVDYVGGELTWYGMGYKKEVGRPDDPAWNAPRDVLFGTGAALITRRELFLETGGFDERFFMFFEDVDYGWRLNLLGWRVRYVPDSVVFHKHHASMKSLGNYHEDFLLDRNALFTLYKNFGDDILASALPAALALTARRAVTRGGLDATSLDIRRAGEDRGETATVSKSGLAGLYAVDSFVENLASLTETRRELQGSRRLADRDLLPLFGDSLRSMQTDAPILDGYRAILDAFDVPARLQQRRRVLIITGDRLSTAMAGPAIRAWNMATLLSREHEVRVVSTEQITTTSPLFELAVAPVHNTHSMQQHVDWCDLIVFQGYALSQYAALQKTDKIMVCDMYDPMHLEQLEQARELGPEQWRHIVSSATDVLNQQLVRGDYFLCASDRQRYFWLGQLAGLGRVNPDNYTHDESLHSLLAVAPFGLDSAPPTRTRPAIKGVVPGIGPDDKVIIWGGGVYNWFDPVTLVKAVHELSRRRPDVRLFFLGMQHPNPNVPQMRAAVQTMELAKQLGIVDTHVFFNQVWVDYEDRQNYLLDADCGVTTHFDHVETTFSFRTRILDYLWAGLPIVTTGGDSFGEMVREKGLGITVGPANVTELAEALEIALYDDAFAGRARANIDGIREQFTWENALAPLLEFCRAPRPAADRAGADTLAAPTVRLAAPAPKSTLRKDAALFKEYVRAGGVREVATRARGRIVRVVRQKVAR